MSINKFFVSGYVGSDPQAFEKDDKEPFVSFSLAEQYGEDSDGNSLVNWHNVTASGRFVPTIMNHVKKGDKLVVEGWAKAKAWVGKDQKLNPQISIRMTGFDFAGSKERIPDDSDVADSPTESVAP